MVVQRRDGPRRLREIDDDDEQVPPGATRTPLATPRYGSGSTPMVPFDWQDATFY